MSELSHLIRAGLRAADDLREAGLSDSQHEAIVRVCRAAEAGANVSDDDLALLASIVERFGNETDYGIEVLTTLASVAESGLARDASGEIAAADLLRVVKGGNALDDLATSELLASFARRFNGDGGFGRSREEYEQALERRGLDGAHLTEAVLDFGPEQALRQCHRDGDFRDLASEELIGRYQREQRTDGVFLRQYRAALAARGIDTELLDTLLLPAAELAQEFEDSPFELDHRFDRSHLAGSDLYEHDIDWD